MELIYINDANPNLDTLLEGLGAVISGTPIGIEFDSDQKLWVNTTIGYYRIDPHYDVVLIDYENKTLYFRENFTEVEVQTND